MVEEKLHFMRLFVYECHISQETYISWRCDCIARKPCMYKTYFFSFLSNIALQIIICNEKYKYKCACWCCKNNNQLLTILWVFFTENIIIALMCNLGKTVRLW